MIARRIVFFWLLLCPLIAMNAFSEQTRDKVMGMSERVFKVMEEAQLLLDTEDYSAAREVLAAGMGRRTSNYERAHLLNIVGFSWYEEDDLEQALDVYDQALMLEDLPYSMLVMLERTIGQVNLVKEDYENAEQHFRALIALPDQNLPGNQVFLAAALIGQDRYKDALQPLLFAIDTEEARGAIPRESWLSMLASVHYELNDFVAMRDVIEKMTLLYPREQYLMNLAALHGELGDSDKQLALIESLLDDGRLQQPSHLKMIVNLYLGEDLPYKAAVLLDRELESGRLEATASNLELLSQAWYMSAEVEKSIEPLEEAAAQSEGGELYLRLARLEMDAYHWDKAATAAAAAIEKSGLRQEGQAWLLRGMAEVRLKRFADARKHFKKASNFDYTEKYATQWLKYVAAEERRLAVTSN